MKNTFSHKQSAISMVVCSALLAMAGQAFAAEDPAVAALTHPSSKVEINAFIADGATSKVGEYSGIRSSGSNATVGITHRFGNGFDSNGETIRYDLKAGVGTLNDNSFEIGASELGFWSAKAHHDEMRHYTGNGYSTPLGGAYSNNLTIAQSFGIINTTAPGTNGLTAGQKAVFHQVDVYSGRKNDGFDLSFAADVMGESLTAKVGFNRLTQDGGKLISASSDMLAPGGGVIATNLAGNSLKVESTMTMINPTSYQTDTFSSSVHWKGESSQLTTSYTGQFFRDSYSTLNFQHPFTANGITGSNPGGAFLTNTLSTAPSNTLHQFSVQGSTQLADDVKVIGGVSRGVNTQNEKFVPNGMQPGALGVLPYSSLNGYVVNTNANLKVIDQVTKDLKVTGGVRFDERDNRTPSGAYYFQDIATNAANIVMGAENRTALNTPLSTRKTVVDLSADYRINKTHTVRADYAFEQQDRWCNNAAVNNFQPVQVAGQGLITAGLITAGNCVSQPHSNDRRLSLSWLGHFESLNANFSLSNADRSTAQTNQYYNPLMSGNKNENFNFIGFQPYYNASRVEQSAKGGVTGQIGEKISYGANARYTQTAYDLALGVKGSRALSVNMDVSYTYGNGKSVSAYYSRSTTSRSMTSGANGTALLAPTLLWTNTFADTSDALGINALYRYSSKIDLAGDLSMSMDSGAYATIVPYVAATCSATNNSGCGVLPGINSRVITAKIAGAYKVTKHDVVITSLTHRRMLASDYFYNAYQLGFTPTSVMPTGESAPNYRANTLKMTYVHSF